MVEVQAHFNNPFTTHTLCVAPFLEKVTTLRSLSSLVENFRIFDAADVAPRIHPNKLRLHRVATHPTTLFVMGT